MKHNFSVRLAAYGFRIGALFLAITIAAVLVFGTPDALKQALHESGAYNAAADTVAKQATKSTELASADTAAKDSFTPQAVRTTSEQNIDHIYDWLEGKTAKPEIKIDLQPYIGSFTRSLDGQATQKAASLPVCTAAQLQTLDLRNINPLDLPCLPPGVNVANAKDQAVNQAVASNDFLQNPVLTADSLPKDVQGKTIIDRAANAPATYQWLMRAPWLFGALALVSAAATLLLWRSDWRQAVRKLARSLLGVGITLLVVVLVVRLLLQFTTKPDGFVTKMVAGNYGEIIMTFVKSIEQAFTTKLLVAGLIYTAIAIIALIVLRFLKPKALAGETVVANSPAIADSQKSPPVIQRDL
jgi:hypothetical protein